eukprot:scaffold52158_cov54-Phaeocystis_antarctica.AAC.1
MMCPSLGLQLPYSFSSPLSPRSVKRRTRQTITRGTAATAGSGAARARARERCTTACSPGPSAPPASPWSVSTK